MQERPGRSAIFIPKFDLLAVRKWRRGWDSNPSPVLKIRKLLILGKPTKPRIPTIPPVGYSLGTHTLALALFLFSLPAHAQEPRCDCSTICERAAAAERCHVGGCNAQERKTFTVKMQSDRERNMVVFECRFKGDAHPRKCILDTGAAITFVSDRLVHPPPNANTLNVQTGSGMVKMPLAAVTLEFAGSSLTGQVFVGRIADDVDVLLGQDFLRRFQTVKIDYKTQTVTLEK